VNINPGTDVQSIINLYPSGTTFCLTAGTYRLTTAVVPKTGDSLIGEAGTVLNGSKVLSSFTQSGSYWYATGQTQQASVATNSCDPITYTGCQYPEGVYYDNASLWQVTSLSELSPGEFYFDYGADKIYVADDPTGHKVEASTAPQAIWGAAGYQDDVTISGLVVEKFANVLDGVHNHTIKPGNDWTIRDNEVRLNHGGGISVGTGSIITGNFIHDNGQYGVFSSGSVGALLENNEIAHNNIDGFDSWDAGGSKFTSTTSLTLRGNYVHDNVGPGLKCDTDSIYTVYEYNVVEHNTREGIMHEVSYDATIRYNTVRFNDTSEAGQSVFYGSNIHLISSQNVEIYGNTVETTGDTNGIGLLDIERGSGKYGKYEIRNDYVHDNTITLTTGGETGLVGNRNSAVYTSMGNSFQVDTYWVPDLSVKFWDWGVGTDSSQTWTGWQGKGNDMAGHAYEK
jgi:hypothetical protein